MTGHVTPLGVDVDEQEHVRRHVRVAVDRLDGALGDARLAVDAVVAG